MTWILLLLSLAQVPAESFPEITEPPDPFQFLDGRRVYTREDWRARRQEMLELVLQYEYGHVPPPPGNVRMEEELASETTDDGRVLHAVLPLTMGPENKIAVTVHLYLPQQEKPPYPAVMRFGLDDTFVPASAGRGYAYVCFDHRDLDPDTEGRDEAGPAQTAYPEYDWGSLAVWAWGACRVLDYLVTRPDINARQVVITGHSRTGKAALLAGALDERFALVVPNGSGCGGAALFRESEKGAETLKFITLPRRFQSWFQKDFGRFGKMETRLPFDQHFMRALVAPRAVLSTDGLEDRWANPRGTQAAWMAAQPVFDFLGTRENNLCHFRDGGHDQTPLDYEVLLDVADQCFRGAALRRDFSVLPEPNLKPSWSWKAPRSDRLGPANRRTDPSARLRRRSAWVSPRLAVRFGVSLANLGTRLRA